MLAWPSRACAPAPALQPPAAEAAQGKKKDKKRKAEEPVEEQV
jgi:hypothetical protein